MAGKPRPKIINRQKRLVDNPHATAADGALLERNAARMHYAIDAEFRDIEANQPAKNRYTRVRAAIMDHFHCSKSEAERAIARAKVYLAQKFVDELPAKRAEICRQLQRIADAQEEAEPQAAIAALREQARILGLHAPQELKITTGEEVPLQLDAVLDVLDEEGLAALRVLQSKIDAAKQAGLLALPHANEDDKAGAIDVEFTESN
ncbi:MAG TPA: hypothetical protein VFT22_07270 [Kofleriaceae bacterium]|nr:hypothetical protein [Kofleriaceae bacterium]